MKKRLRIGIFGGSFDPPHVAHLIVAETARSAARLDKVFFVPASQSPNKFRRPGATERERLAMTRLAVRGNKDFSVVDLELRRGGISYTVDTLQSIAAQNPSAEIFLIIGADRLADFPTWKDPETIVSLSTLLVYPRHGFRAGTSGPFARSVQVLEAPEIEISSSLVRRRLAGGQSVRYTLPASVEEYIRRKRLYRA